MREELETGRLRRVPHLQRREIRLARFAAQLDLTAEAFKVRLHRYQISSCVPEYTLCLDQIHRPCRGATHASHS
jgi:hypothetical protein